MMKKWRWAILCAMALTALFVFGSAAAADTLTLPADLTTIEDEAFRGVTGVDAIDLPAGVTHIGAGAFRDCGDPAAELRWYYPPSGISVGADAFEGCRATIRINGVELPRLTYTVASGGVTITGVSGQPTEVVIPDVIGGKPVVAIGSGVFNGKSAMTRVVIPATVTSVGQNAFRGCSALTGIDLPAGLTSLGSNAFRDCSSLTEITLPAGVTALPSEVFRGCQKLARVNLQGALTSIGNGAFNDCYVLADFEIPATVTQIGEYAFRYCRALTQATVPSGVTALAEGVFTHCDHLQSVQLPQGLESIGQAAFDYCIALTELELPQGLTSLGAQAFYNCQALTEITLPAGITTLPSETFYNCYALTRVDLPQGLTSVGSYVFNDCRALTSVSLPAGVTTLPNNAFRNANGLTEITLPAGLTTLGTGVFYDCRALTSISLPAGVTALPNETFFNCYALAEIDLPDGLTSLGTSAFGYCRALTGIDLPAGVTALPQEAFRGCTLLGSIDLTGIATLGNGALRDCTALTEVTIPASVTALPKSLFEDATGLTRVYLPNTLTTIDEYAFYHCSALTEIEIPSGVTAIPYGCFAGCSALGRVQLPAGLLSIAQNAFRSCTMLTNINFPASLTSIGQEAFRDTCVGQAANVVYVLPGTVETFGSNAFYNCGAGLLVEEGSDQEAFVKANGYTFAYDADDGFRYQWKKVNNVDTLHLTGYKGAGGNLTIPAGPAVIGESAFENNTAITGVTIPAGVVTIDRYAFSRCANLARVAMSDTVTTIKNNAFYACANLTDVTFSANLASIGADAFDYACTAAGTHFYNLPDHITALDWSPFSDCGAVPCFNRGSDTAALFRSSNNTSSIYYTYAGETDFRYRWYNNEGTEGHRERLMQYTGNAQTVNIPAYVWLIDDGAFQGNTSIRKVVIPEGVSKIGNNAFRDCANLTDITLPDSLTFLMDNVFRGCGSNAAEPFLFYLPDDIGNVYANVFTDCPAILVCGIDTTTASRISNRGWSFARNDRPDELDIRYKYGYIDGNVWVPKLYDYAGNLTSVRLPDDCPNVDSSVLRQKVNDGLELVCGQLSDTAEGLSRAETNFTFPGHEGLRYRIIENVLYVMGWTGTGTTITIPKATDWIAAGRDERIRAGAFLGQEAVTRVVISEGVTQIDDGAFTNCYNLTDITFPSTLKKLEQNAFRYCGRDAEEPFYFILPDNMEEMAGRGGGAQTFSDCNAILQTGKYSKTAELLTDRNFSYTVAGEHDFRYRYISYTEGEETGRRLWLAGFVGEGPEVTIPAGIYGIYRYAPFSTYDPGFFGREDITKVVIPEGTVELEDSAFRGCVNLTDITFPSTLKKLWNHAVQDCGSASTTLHYYVLPDNIELIGAYTANDWGTFNDMNLGRLVCAVDTETARIVSNAYTNHYNGSYFFALKGHQTDGLIYRYERYDTDTQGEYDYRLSLWQYEGSDIEVTIPADCGLWRIESGVFQNRNNIEKVVIPSGVTEIGASAFDGCAMLHSGTDTDVIVIPSGVKKAESLAFKGLGSAITQRFFLVLPASLTEFDLSIFMNCNAVLVAPAGSAVAQALYENWYYYYNTLEDAQTGSNLQVRRIYDAQGVEIEHEHFGRR